MEIEGYTGLSKGCGIGDPSSRGEGVYINIVLLIFLCIIQIITILIIKWLAPPKEGRLSGSFFSMITIRSGISSE